MPCRGGVRLGLWGNPQPRQSVLPLGYLTRWHWCQKPKLEKQKYFINITLSTKNSISVSSVQLWHFHFYLTVYLKDWLYKNIFHEEISSMVCPTQGEICSTFSPGHQTARQAGINLNLQYLWFFSDQKQSQIIKRLWWVIWFNQMVTLVVAVHLRHHLTRPQLALIFNPNHNMCIVTMYLQCMFWRNHWRRHQEG